MLALNVSSKIEPEDAIEGLDFNYQNGNISLEKANYNFKLLGEADELDGLDDDIVVFDDIVNVFS